MLSSLAQRALHRLDDRHEEGAQEGWLLAHLDSKGVPAGCGGHRARRPEVGVEGGGGRGGRRWA